MNADDVINVTVTWDDLASVNQHSIIEVHASGGYAEGNLQAQVTGKHY